MVVRTLRHRWGAEECAAFLATVRLFEGLPPSAVLAVAARFRPRRVKRAAFIFLEGEPASALNLLAEGGVKVVREAEGGEVILRLIGPGEIFGAPGGWGEPVYPASAVAQRDALVLQLPADDLAALVAARPAFAMAIIRELGIHLREAEARIHDLQTQRAERRIARTLLRLARRTGVAAEVEVEPDIALSRQELAGLAGTTLSTASRTLSAWNRRGIVAARRERVAILRRGELLEIAADRPADGVGGDA